VVIAIFTNPTLGFAVTVNRRTGHDLEFLEPLGLAAIDFRLGHTSEKLVSALAAPAGDAIDFEQELVGDLDLEPGHLARVSRGFG
jgi:hypothetical protein